MKILMLVSRVPYPLEKGDKLRAFHQLRELSKRHEIFLVCLSESRLHPHAIEKLSPYCAGIEIVRISKVSILINLLRGLLSGLPLQVAYFSSYRARRMIGRFINSFNPDVVFCQLIRMAPFVMYKRSSAMVLDYMDIFSKGVERRISGAPFFLKSLLKMERNRLLRFEEKVFERFDQRTIISEQDRELVPHPQKNLIHVIPNGVDADFFRPMESEKDYDIVFTGNMNYPPNIESSIYLARRVFPLVREKVPEARLLIAGANPAPKIKAMESESITVTGWVEDIRTCYARSRIFVAPMLISIGMQNKLLEAMAMGMPCITSSLANNAIKAPVGDCILVANTPQEYADKIVGLLKDPDLAQKIAEAGYRFVRSRYSWSASGEMLSHVLESASQRGRR